jgi:hypothetical protein
MKKAPTTFTAITGIALMTALTAQGAFVISQPDTDGNTGTATRGQSFRPSVGMVDDPGASTTTIDLVSISFWAGGGGNTTSDTTYLLIFSAKPSTTSGSSVGLVGSSTNFLDLSPIPSSGTQLTWTFNNLTLDYDTTHYAVFSDNNSGTSAFGFQLQKAGTTTVNPNPYTGGGALDGSYNANSVQDAKFLATFTNPVPEPSAVLLGAVGMLALLRRRRV